ncbi:squamous cell carcinoma antigen recognized by T-cells 3-like [Saccostrea echinata]|uniref:squamous cell carcinoma antigen recognized by T-cells 3-like n=1 Tax=Saccostrea echinata TaxID=191078 RepID=UPI002A7F1A2D|nr:squamous cell carcinoma antigen recognized by T-cells 3-like [Saccostrea echinata]
MAESMDRGDSLEIIQEESENNAEETEDAEMKSDNSSSSDSGGESEDDDDEEANKKRLEELQTQIEENPYLYDGHTEMIKLLRNTGELEKLRDAREKMSQYFPLTQDLWLEWLRDEIPLATDESERKHVYDLFERAVKDYLSVDVWLEYVQFCIGGMGQIDGMSHIRDVFERALSAAGLHVAAGSSLWEAYREFENALMSGYMPQPGQVATPEQEEKFNTQQDRVVSLFKRQLSIPLMDMQETMAEFKEYFEDEIDDGTKEAYSKALDKLEKLIPYEEALNSAEPPRLDAYLSYIDYEMTHDDPARIHNIFERALQENCLNAELWLKYAKYLDHKRLQVETLVLGMYERSVRNCPWCSQLWQRYILAMERFHKSQKEIKELVDRALQCGFNSGADYLVVWSTYCDYLRRRIKWDQEHEDELELFRITVESAVNFLSYYGVEADPKGSLQQFWAVIEGKFCKNMTRAREIWNDIMSAGRNHEAALWLDYLKIERAYGDNKHCRKLLNRALNVVTDWPEGIVEAMINFEREEGNLEQYDTAVTKCEIHMDAINKERKESELEEKRQNRRLEKKQKRFDAKEKGKKGKKDGNERKKSSPKESADKSSQKEKTDKSENRKRKSEEEQAEFKVPAVPSSKGPPPPGFKEPPPPESKGPPPPGYKGPPPGYKGGEHAAKKPKIEEETSNSGGQGDGSNTQVDFVEKAEQDPNKSKRTAFVSNLDYSIDEDRIGQLFAKCGEMTDIRLVKTIRGKSKGYAYVEFKDELGMLEALKLDRTPVEGRPVFVSKCEDRSQKKAQFKFSTEMEKNKLFVKNLPFTCTREALIQIFSEHGPVREVRMVTYRSGAPKGLAYVEFEDEQDAAKAVVKTDGLKIGEHEIEVAISNPPQRGTPLSSRDETSFTPTLGGGKKETEVRGKARTQLSLVPRSIQRTPATAKNSKPPPPQNTESNGQPVANATATKMSNDDFRKMLLKK